MAEEGSGPLRSWQEIAEEASKEQDPEKLLRLTQELERALDKRDEDLRQRKTASAVQNSATDPPRRASRSKTA